MKRRVLRACSPAPTPGRPLRALESTILSRTESYLGVMVDDLTTRGVAEPYRMFTSRAEFRLHLRSDNADQRLTQLGIERGWSGEQRSELFHVKQSGLRSGRAVLDGLRITPTEAQRAGIAVNADGHRRSAFELLSYPTVGSADVVRIWPELAAMPSAILEQLAVDAQYAVYLDRQRADVEAVRRDEQREIPAWLDYEQLPGLSTEIRQKLMLHRPATIAQAQAIDGVTASSITLLLSIIRRGTLRKAG
jgi:tRNA uridine 5-carboxymethylaminomethyl modification enzyme